MAGARRPRPSRSAGLRERASPPPGSAARSISPTWPRAARSSSSGPTATSSRSSTTSWSSSSRNPAAGARPAGPGTSCSRRSSRRSSQGLGTAEDLQDLEAWGKLVKTTSRCGLGQTSPNPILTTHEELPRALRAKIRTGRGFRPRISTWPRRSRTAARRRTVSRSARSPSMTEIRFTIDGKECLAKPGQTIVEAAKANGVYIPVLCPLRGPQARRQLPDLHGPRRRPVHGRLHPACDRGHGRREHRPGPRGHAQRPSSRCSSSRATTSARRAKRAATASSRPWPTATGCMAPRFPYLLPGRDLDASAPKLMLDRNRCIQCLRCVRGVQAKDGRKVFASVEAAPGCDN